MIVCNAISFTVRTLSFPFRTMTGGMFCCQIFYFSVYSYDTGIGATISELSDNPMLVHVDIGISSNYVVAYIGDFHPVHYATDDLSKNIVYRHGITNTVQQFKFYYKIMIAFYNFYSYRNRCLISSLRTFYI